MRKIPHYNRGSYSQTDYKAVVFKVRLGKHMLLATIVNPKELFPVQDRSINQKVVKETDAAAITEVYFVPHSGKEVIENFFDANYKLNTG